MAAALKAAEQWLPIVESVDPHALDECRRKARNKEIKGAKVIDPKCSRCQFVQVKLKSQRHLGNNTTKTADVIC